MVVVERRGGGVPSYTYSHMQVTACGVVVDGDVFCNDCMHDMCHLSNVHLQARGDGEE